MEINVSVQHKGGLLPDVISLTRCGYIGEPVQYHEKVLSLQPMFPPTKPLDIFPPEGGCSEGLDAFRFFVNNCIYSLCNSILLPPCVMVYYIVSVLFLLFFWYSCMAINV